MFVGRKSELNEMNRLYQQNQFQFYVLYGRRRIGKTTLIKEFMKDKRGLFFVAQEANDYMNLVNISKREYMNSFIFHPHLHHLITGMVYLILSQKKQ